MTTVRIAHAEPRPGKLSNGEFQTRGHLVVLADDAAHRAVPVWLSGEPGEEDLARLVELAAQPTGEVIAADAPEELTARLLHAAGAGVTEVDIQVTDADANELRPQAAVTHIGLSGPAGTRRVTAGLGLGMAMAAAAGAPVRLADEVVSRLAVSVPGDDLLGAVLDRMPPMAQVPPQAALAVLRPGNRPRYEPRNLDLADGLDGWLLSGSFIGHASHSYWEDYSCAVEDGAAVLSSTVPQPAGYAALGQQIFADYYRGTVVAFGGEFRSQDAAGTDPASRTGLFLRVVGGHDSGRPRTADEAATDPANSIVTISADRDWTSHRITVRIPDNADTVTFGVFLVGRGQIEMRHAHVARSV